MKHNTPIDQPWYSVFVSMRRSHHRQRAAIRCDIRYSHEHLDVTCCWVGPLVWGLPVPMPAAVSCTAVQITCKILDPQKEC